MYVELIKQTLFWKMRDAVKKQENYEKVDFTEVNYIIEQLLHGAESCQEMINNRRKISDKDFYSMLNEFAYISDWNDYDCYNVLEMAYNTKFAGYATINTTMHTTIQKTAGHGRDFSWWDEEVGVNFKILYTEDFNVDYEHFYTINEIKKLVAEKKIIIVSERQRNLAWEEYNYKKEKYQAFNYAYNYYSMQYEFFNEGGKFYKYTLKYIKKKLNSRQLKKLFSEHLDHVEGEVYEATDSRNYDSDSSWAHTAKEYSKEFEKCGYAKRLTRLKETKNNK